MGAASGDFGWLREHIAWLHADAQHAGVQIVSGGQTRQNALDARQGDGEANARVIPFDAGQGAAGVGRQRYEQAEDAAGDIDERPAIIGWRDFGVGLDGPSPHAIERADDADRHIRRIGGQRATDGDGPGADAHLFGRNRLGCGQRGRGVNRKQHQHPAMIGGHELGRQPGTIGQGDQDRIGTLNEIEGTGDDQSFGIDHQAGGGTGPDEHLPNAFQPTDGFDPHNRGSNLGDRGLDGPLFQLGQGLGGAGQGRRHEGQQQRRQEDDAPRA